MTKYATPVHHWHRFRVWTIDNVPMVLVVRPLELALAVALVGLGIGLLAQDVQPGSVVQQVPPWMVEAWSLMLLTGGLCTLFGLSLRYESLRWAGQNLSGFGCGFYAMAVYNYPATPFSQGGIVVIIFGLLALGCWWKAFLITMRPWIKARQARELAHRIVQ